MFAFLFVALFASLTQGAQIEFSNRCGHDIWISPLTNARGPELAPGIVRIANYGNYAYQIPSTGW